MRLKGVSVVRRKCLKPAAMTVSRSASSVATAPRAGPPRASEQVKSPIRIGEDSHAFQEPKCLARYEIVKSVLVAINSPLGEGLKVPAAGI